MKARRIVSEMTNDPQRLRDRRLRAMRKNWKPIDVNTLPKSYEIPLPPKDDPNWDRSSQNDRVILRRNKHGLYQ